ncbi:unnamed protein product, partial [Rotaria magnacalcarata]
MVFFKFILIIGLFVTMTRADCPVTDDPKELVHCLQYFTSVLYGAIVKDVTIICKVAADVAKCLREEMGDCIAAEMSKAALHQAKELAENCCPERNNTKCPIRDSVFSMQRCFAADSLVTLVGGAQKRITEVESGDKVLAYDDKTSKVISTNIITMLDHQPNQY